MRVMVLHNPTAGDGWPPAADLLRLLYDAGLEPVYASTKEPGFEAAVGSPADLLIVAGGDGTVTKVAAALADRRRPIAILPLGGANNIARSLGIGGELSGLIASLGEARVRRVDVASAAGPWGRRLVLEGVGLGALPRASADAEASEPAPAPADKIRVGRETLRRRLRHDASWRLRLELDGEVLEGDFLMVEAVNLQTTGPALPLAPGADPGDGCLDIIGIGLDHRDRMLAWLDRRSPGEPPPGERRRCRRLAFDWADVPLRLDDGRPDPPAEPARVVVEVEAEPLRVLVPAGPVDAEPRERS